MHFLTLAACLALATCTEPAYADPLPVPTTAAQANVESADLARLDPIARRALQEVVAYRWPYLAPGGDVAKVQDYGGEWPVRLLALMARYRTPAFMALAREATAGAGGAQFTTADLAAARLDERRKVIAEIAALIARENQP